VAKKLDFEDGAELEMAVDRGGLWIRRSRPRRPNLRVLLDGITPENRHGEVSIGLAVGREVIED
jgi:antitoxin component of MazEF toxin-antitoxin module